MNLVRIDFLLNAQNQRFLCEAAGVRHGDQEREIEITHEVTPGLTASEFEVYEAQSKGLELLRGLLTRYGSLRLFCDTFGRGSAFYIAQPDEWDELRSDFVAWLSDLDDQERLELVPDWVDDSLVFGEVPESGNFYLMPLSGKLKGAVFEFEHDGFEFNRVAADLQEFVDNICTVTPNLVSMIRSHARYFDGVTDVQWIPKSYCYEDEEGNSVAVGYQKGGVD